MRTEQEPGWPLSPKLQYLTHLAHKSICTCRIDEQFPARTQRWAALHRTTPTGWPQECSAPEVIVSLGVMSCITERGIIDSLSLAVESQGQPHRQAFVFCVLSRSLNVVPDPATLHCVRLGGQDRPGTAQERLRHTSVASCPGVGTREKENWGVGCRPARDETRGLQQRH